jgi:hypothetical protein
MQKVKAISLVFLGVLLAYAGSYLLQPSVNLDQKVLDVKLSDTLSIVGYRNNSGNATVAYTYNFYIKSQADKLPPPFLVTGTPTLDVDVRSDKSFSADLTGKVYKFTNIVWVKEGEQLVPINIEMHTKNN